MGAAHAGSGRCPASEMSLADGNGLEHAQPATHFAQVASWATVNLLRAERDRGDPHEST
jgi:hypothetical protein